MSSTSAVDVSIQAVSPELIWLASTRCGALLSADCANACPANADRGAAHEARAAGKFFPLMPIIQANGKPYDFSLANTNSPSECALRPELAHLFIDMIVAAVALNGPYGPCSRRSRLRTRRLVP